MMGCKNTKPSGSVRWEAARSSVCVTVSTTLTQSSEGIVRVWSKLFTSYNREFGFTGITNTQTFR